MQRYNSLEKRVALTHYIKERNSHNSSHISTGGFTLMDDTFSKGMQFYCQAITNTKINFLTAATWYKRRVKCFNVTILTSARILHNLKYHHHFACEYMCLCVCVCVGTCSPSATAFMIYAWEKERKNWVPLKADIANSNIKVVWKKKEL